MTLNVQAVATAGTLTGASCHFDFGDGYRSDSCNPGVHSYQQVGSYILNLAVVNQCGNTLIQSQTVIVYSDGKTPTAASAVSAATSAYDDSRIVISGVLPNPDSKDADKEWIELHNLEDRTVGLAGWHLAVGNKTIRRYVIDSVASLSSHETVRLYQSETSISLSNATDTVELLNPLGIVVSSVHWEKAEEGRVYYSDSFKDQSLRGTVYPVIDPEHFSINFDGPSSLLTGLTHANVKLIGVTDFDASASSQLLEYKFKSLELVRALIENKKVELYFDSDVWDTEGNLLAYVMLDDGRILQNELLLSGLSIAKTDDAYASRQSYIDAQNRAINNRLGIWSILDINEMSMNERALEKAKIVASTIGISDSTFHSYSGSILITEVFPSPSSKQESGSVLAQEWVEFFNTTGNRISLEGWKFIIGKKVVTFGPSSILEAGKHMVFFVHQVGLKLKNDGDDIRLNSPDDSYSVLVSYPKTKVGESYVFDERTKTYCMTKSTSPGSAGSCGIAAASSVSKKVAAKTTARKSRYDTYAESYKNTVGEGSNQEPILLATPESQGMPFALSVIFGILLGSIGSIVALKIPAVRVFIS